MKGLRSPQFSLASYDFELGGDVITAVDGVPLHNAEQLNMLVLYDGAAGDQLQLEILRGRQETTAIVTLEVMP